MKQRKGSFIQGHLRSRILPCSIAIVILLMTAIAGCSQSATGLDDSEKAAMREVREIAAVAATLLNVYMDARVTDMLVGSKLGGPLRDALTMHEARADANRILEEWLKISGAYEAILLLDENGVCLASAPAGLVNQDFSDDNAFKGAVNGKLTISDVHKSDVLMPLHPKSEGWAATIAGWTVTIAVPIKVGNDLEGVLISYLKWSRLVELVASVVVGKTGYVYLLNKQNQVIIHPTVS